MNTLPLIIAKQSVALNATMLGFAAAITVGLTLMTIGFWQGGYMGNKCKNESFMRWVACGVYLTGFSLFGALVVALFVLVSDLC